MDMVLACLAILLGASLANVVDEAFSFTPKVSAWLQSMLE